MAIEIKVPRLGWSMEEGTFIEWLKREGEQVKSGEPLFAIEGDKAIQEVEAIGSGILRISPTAPQSGETVQVGTVLAFLVAADEPLTTPPADLPVAQPSSERANRQPTHAGPLQQPVRSDSAAVRIEPLSAARQRISPRAARAATRLGVDCSGLVGSGQSGRIRERDVIAAASQRDSSLTAGPTAAPRPQVATTQSSLRRTIAARMAQSAQTTAPVTLTTTADASNLVSLRTQFRASGREGQVPSYTDLIVKLVARALGEHRALNQQWVDGQIIDPDGVHISIAIDTPAGLLAPVVRNVPALGLRELADKTADLRRRALDSKLSAEELGGGTFTVSNLGAFGIDGFTPIINLPQCAILGVGRIEKRPAVVGDQIVPRDQVTLSLTFDHRIVDGAPAARFLAALRGGIENPGPWLVF